VAELKLALRITPFLNTQSPLSGKAWQQMGGRLSAGVHNARGAFLVEAGFIVLLSKYDYPGQRKSSRLIHHYCFKQALFCQAKLVAYEWHSAMALLCSRTKAMHLKYG
jgi:hypothetical protein